MKLDEISCKLISLSSWVTSFQIPLNQLRVNLQICKFNQFSLEAYANDFVTKAFDKIDSRYSEKQITKASDFTCIILFPLSPICFCKIKKKSSKQVTFEVQHVPTKLSATHPTILIPKLA